MRKFNTAYKYLLCFLLLSSTALAVDWDSKGTDFWLTFPPNFHMNKTSGIERLSLGDSLYIFITSDVPVSGRIEYCDLSGNSYNQNFSINDPSQIFIFRVCFLDYELLGYNDSGILGTRNQSESVKKQYFHITSDNEVTVYAHNQASKSSDACIVLPTDILGKDYFVMTYKSDGNTNISTGNLTGSSTPSQFVVLGTEDNTSVTIMPNSETQYNGTNIQRFILNKGEAYLVQSRIESIKLNYDLSGTEIHSDKPIAVFASHQRANVPIVLINSPSRDYLFEQMPPIETWGKNALLVPYVQPGNITVNGTDIFRILSANNNTDIYINGVLVKRLNKGEFFEGQLVQPSHVEASAPVLVAQFKKTSDYGAGTILGDPFEMLIPPIEQFMTNYRVINTQAFEYDRDWFGQPIYHKVYNEQYITIVAPDTSIASVLLDGNSLQISDFIPISTSNFLYANIPVSDGVHTITCDDKIGVYVYGYGQANSYGYVGGMKMMSKRNDTNKPVVFVNSDPCNQGAEITISDSTIFDMGLASVDILDTINCRVTKETYLPMYEKLIITVIDPYKDAIYHITATDSAGFVTDITDTIQGFTIEFPELLSNAKGLDFDSTVIGEIICDSLLIRNTGLLPITFDSNVFIINNIIFSIPVTQLPVTINPGTSEQLKICYSPTVAFFRQQYDTLIFEFNCIMVRVNLFGISKPKIEIAGNKNNRCNMPLKLIIYELPETNFLGQNYPNPASDISSIRFGISEQSPVTLNIYDLFGERKMTVFSENLLPGLYYVQINTNNLSQGVYIYSLHTEKSVLTKTMVIEK